MSDHEHVEVGDYSVCLEGGGEQGVLLVLDALNPGGPKGFYLSRAEGPLLLQPLGNGRFVENGPGAADAEERVWVLNK